MVNIHPTSLNPCFLSALTDADATAAKFTPYREPDPTFHPNPLALWGVLCVTGIWLTFYLFIYFLTVGRIPFLLTLDVEADGFLCCGRRWSGAAPGCVAHVHPRVLHLHVGDDEHTVLLQQVGVGRQRQLLSRPGVAYGHAAHAECAGFVWYISHWLYRGVCFSLLTREWRDDNKFLFWFMGLLWASGVC